PIAAQVVHAERVTPLVHLEPKEDPGPYAAINGAFYEKGPMGLVVSDGVERHPLEARGGSGIFLVDEDGPMIVPREDWQPGPAPALQSIDRIVHLGENLVAKETGAPRAARSAVVVGQHHVWLVV